MGVLEVLVYNIYVQKWNNCVIPYTHVTLTLILTLIPNPNPNPECDPNPKTVGCAGYSEVMPRNEG